MIQFEFDGHKIEFDQVLAGFAWPTDEPGFSVVIGEQYLRKATGDEVHYYNLGETENIKMDALIQDTIRLRRKFEVQGVWGRSRETASKVLPSMNYLLSWNKRSRSRGGAELFVGNADYTEPNGYIEFHCNLIRSMSMDDKKQLLLGTNSKLPTYLNDVPEDISQLTDINFPAVAALGYVLATLEAHRGSRHEDLMAEKLTEEYHGDG